MSEDARVKGWMSGANVKVLGVAFCAWLHAGCGVCSRPVVFDVRTLDSASAPISGARVAVTCREKSGTELSRSADSDATGRATVPRITSTSDPCPESGRELIAPYLEQCIIAVSAAGFRDSERTLSGEQMDSLSSPAGDGARISLVFSLQR